MWVTIWGTKTDECPKKESSANQCDPDGGNVPFPHGEAHCYCNSDFCNGAIGMKNIPSVLIGTLITMLYLIIEK